ncbi:hypothetical protein PVAG01_02296 [Phlyctema vagabunda]|uniref:Transmembrane protein n=1 Tax=Phlyctema vagabunda TaxID=108571 RepID=A0ABR4PQC0_9HELO
MVSLPLAAALAVLLVDSAIELAFISSMVGYLLRTAKNEYPFEFQGSTAVIRAEPRSLLVNQGHTSNGAAGTALVIICFGGFVTLFLERRREKQGLSYKPSIIFLIYTVLTILSALLSLAALAYTLTVTYQTNDQDIVQSIAAAQAGGKYPVQDWTPDTWTRAMLRLPLTDGDTADRLRYWLRIIDGWKWNLIPLFLIGTLVAVLCVKEYFGGRRRGSEEKVVNGGSL